MLSDAKPKPAKGPPSFHRGGSDRVHRLVGHWSSRLAQVVVERIYNRWFVPWTLAVLSALLLAASGIGNLSLAEKFPGEWSSADLRARYHVLPDGSLVPWGDLLPEGDLVFDELARRYTALVSAGYWGFGLRAIVIGAAMLLYLASLLWCDARRFYHGDASWLVHWGWGIAALGWIVFGALQSLLGMSRDSFLQALRTVPPIWLSAVCLLQATEIGASWRRQPSGTKRLAGLLATGFLGLTIVEILTSGAIRQAVNELSVAFKQADRQFYLKDVAGQLDAILAVSPWLMIGYAYLLTARTENDLPAFVRRCPSGPPIVRRAGSWLLVRRDVLYAWLPVAIALWLFSADWLAQRDWLAPKAPPTLTGETAHAVGTAAGRAIALAPAYVLLMIPAYFVARALASANVGGKPMTTERRAELLSQVWPVAWLIGYVVGLRAGSIFMWSYALGQSAATSVADHAALWVRPFSAQQAHEVGGIVVAAFASIALHYLVLLELPFWRGQRRWKTAEVRRTGDALREADEALRTRLAPSARQESVQVHETTRRLADYVLAQDEARKAKEISVHTIKSLPDLLRKFSGWLGGAMLAAIQGQQNSAEMVQGALKTIWDWFIG